MSKTQEPEKLNFPKRMLKRLTKINFKKENKNYFTILSGIMVSGELNPEPLDLEKFTYDPGSQMNFADYTICNELMAQCYDLAYLPKTETFVLSNDSFCKLVEQDKLFVNNISQSLKIDKVTAVNQITKFFEKKTLLIQQTGLQGYLYRLGTFAQTAGSASMVSRTLVMAKAAGVTGLNIIKSQPLMVITLPTVGSMFFHGCGSVIGNNTIGRTCNTIGDILNIPMGFTESVYNIYAAPFVYKILGIPTTLNYTKQAMRGPGLDGTEAFKQLEAGHKKNAVKVLKSWLANLAMKVAKKAKTWSET